MFIELIVSIFIRVIFIFCSLLLGRDLSFLSGYKGIESLLDPEKKKY